MTTRSIDSNGDWQFGNGKQDYKTEEKELLQNIITSLRSWKNNCFFDLEAGVDWQNIIGSFNKNNYLISQVSSVILSINNVIKINNININHFDKRNIILEININTIYSQNLSQIIEV